MSILQWKEFMELGKEVSDETLQARMDELVPNRCCTLVYTVSHSIAQIIQSWLQNTNLSNNIKKNPQAKKPLKVNNNSYFIALLWI